MNANEVFSQITDKRIQDTILLAALDALGDTIEPPEFWSKVANDHGYSPFHRRKCIFELFKRHIKAGISLAGLAATLDKPTWLKRENVVIVTRLGGKLPFSWSSQDTVVMIYPDLPQGNYSAIYLKIGHKELQAENIFTLLKDNETNPKYNMILISEVSLNETIE